MNIEIGDIVKNKTWSYLAPVLRGHGDHFVSLYKNVQKLALGIRDTSVEGVEKYDKKAIYILVDKAVRPKCYKEFLAFMSYQDYCIGNYPYDDIHNGRKQMFVVEIPKLFEKAYEHFVCSQYSLMYTMEEAIVLFLEHNRKAEFDVLTKRSEAYDKHLKRINNEWGTTLTSFNGEYDFPLMHCAEIFNSQEERLIKSSDLSFLVDSKIIEEI